MIYQHVPFLKNGIMDAAAHRKIDTISDYTQLSQMNADDVIEIVFQFCWFLIPHGFGLAVKA